MNLFKKQKQYENKGKVFLNRKETRFAGFHPDLISSEKQMLLLEVK